MEKISRSGGFLRLTLLIFFLLSVLAISVGRPQTTHALTTRLSPISGRDTTVGNFLLTEGYLEQFKNSDFETGPYNRLISYEYQSCRCTTAAWPRGVNTFDENEFIELGFAPDISSSANIKGAEIIFEYQRNGPLDKAKLEIWEEDIGQWHDVAIGIPAGIDQDQTFVIDISSFIDSAADANNLKTRFLAYTNDGGANSKTIQTFHDYAALVLNLNYPPTLAPIGNREINEGETLTFAAEASDEDGDPIIFSSAGFPASANFDSLSWIFSWTPDYNASGTYPGITFTASDGTASASETIAIVVKNTNRPPIIVSIEPKEIYEAETLAFEVSGSDPDGDTLTFYADELPDGAVFDVSSGSFVWVPQKGQAGDYEFIFGISDGTDSGEITAEIKILSKPEPAPSPSLIPTPTPSQTPAPSPVLPSESVLPSAIPTPLPPTQTPTPQLADNISVFGNSTGGMPVPMDAILYAKSLETHNVDNQQKILTGTGNPLAAADIISIAVQEPETAKLPVAVKSIFINEKESHKPVLPLETENPKQAQSRLGGDDNKLLASALDAFNTISGHLSRILASALFKISARLSFL